MAEVNKHFKTMQRPKAGREDKVTTDLFNDGGQTVLKNLGALYTQCLLTSTVLESWKNANIILINKKAIS